MTSPITVSALDKRLVRQLVRRRVSDDHGGKQNDEQFDGAIRSDSIAISMGGQQPICHHRLIQPMFADSLDEFSSHDFRALNQPR